VRATAAVWLAPYSSHWRITFSRPVAGLADADEQPITQGLAEQELDDLRSRQDATELPGEIDAGFLRVALMGALLAPVALPYDTRQLTGMDPGDPQFAQAWVEQVRRLVRRLSSE
jgi:TetR/AcrR family transcriptional regulator